jgi:dienelactone hydrolase
MAAATFSPPVDEQVRISRRGFDLCGRLVVPEPARGYVVFVHDVGSDASNSGDQQVAAQLRESGLGTFLFDLLAPGEGAGSATVVDLDVLAVRLLLATRWLEAHTSASGPQVGYYGTRVGAAVALMAAADDPSIGAVCARSGRLDLVASVLTKVTPPTLLVVGAADGATRASNERGARVLPAAHELTVVPGASEPFVEPHALETTASLASSWFRDHLAPARRES